MEQVKIVHPAAGEATVPAIAVPMWRSSGWRPASEVEAEQQDEPQDGGTPPSSGQPATEPGQEETKPGARARRQPSKESE